MIQFDTHIYAVKLAERLKLQILSSQTEEITEVYEQPSEYYCEAARETVSECLFGSMLPALTRESDTDESQAVTAFKEEVQNLYFFEPLLPAPEMKIPSYKWIYPAAIGALAGNMIFPRLFQIAWGSMEAGKAVGAPIGSVILILFTAWVVENPKVYRFFQVLLGTAAVMVTADIILEKYIETTIAGRFFSSVKQVFSKKETGMYTKIKLLGGLIFSMMFLVVMCPVKQYRRESVCRAIEQYAELIVVINTRLALSMVKAPEPVLQIESQQETFTDINTLTLLFDQLKAELAAGKSADNTLLRIEGVLSGFAVSEGFDADGKTFSSELLSMYETWGVIREGDIVEVLEPAILKDDEVVKKGKIQRKRS